MRNNFLQIINILSLLLVFNGGFMLLCLPISLIYNDGDWQAFLISFLVSAAVGGIIWMLTRQAKREELRKRDGYLIVTLGWIIMSLSGSLPYVFSSAIPFYADAFFETASGYTTTGASILNNIEELPRGILFWRSLTQWIGGMGIIVLAVAILPLLGIGGMQLFVAESPGIAPDKIQPRIKATAGRLWLVYIVLTFSEMVLLMLGGMNFYEAINHSLTTMATGGFSTKQDSVAFYDSAYIQYIIILFMFLAGTNFTITYFGLHGKLKRFWENDEFRFYFFIILGASVITAATLYFYNGFPLEKSIRDSLFQVISVITTTGYVTADYTSWTPFLTVVFFVMMFVGGSAGSTAGGVKIIRHLILLKNMVLEFKRILHPSAVIPVRFNKMAVNQEVTFNVLAFIMTYILIFAIGSVIMSAMGLDFLTAIGAVATSLGNIGPGIGNVGPVDNFANIPLYGKWFLTFLMLIGRLELFTVLIIFTPYFWRSK